MSDAALTAVQTLTKLSNHPTLIYDVAKVTAGHDYTKFWENLKIEAEKKRQEKELNGERTKNVFTG